MWSSFSPCVNKKKTRVRSAAAPKRARFYASRKKEHPCTNIERKETKTCTKDFQGGCVDCCLVGEWTGWGHCMNDGTAERTHGNGGNDGHGGHGNRQVRVRMLVELKAAQEARV